ncbi:MAG TPA: arginine--tRNA ligase [Abditibacteriaceae bacterium]|jgi:arginyl-tRNA synthetase
MSDSVPTRRHLQDLLSTVEFDGTSMRRAEKSHGDWTIRGDFSSLASAWSGAVETAGGWTNFRMNDEQLRGALAAALSQNERYGASQSCAGRTLVEFVSADPVGPLPFSVARSAAAGDALCRLLAFAGADITREWYLNDIEASPKLHLLGESVGAAYSAHFGQNADFDGALDDAFVRSVAAEEAKAGNQWLLAPHEESVAHFAHAARDAAVASHRATIEKFGVRFDVWTSESTLRNEGRVEGAIRRLRERGHVYENGGATWLKTSQFGDDADRVLLRRDGTPTYFAADIAYHLFKLERGFTRVVDVWTAEHRPYIERTRAAIRALGIDDTALEFIPCESARWRRDGKSVVRGRGGSDWTLDEAAEELDADTIKFWLLRAPWNEIATLDYERARRDDETNVAYAVRLLPSRLQTRIGELEARGNSAGETWSDDERAIARLVALWPDTAENAALERAPWRVAAWLEELAAAVRDDLKTAHNEAVTSAQTLRAAHISATNALQVLGLSPDNNF